jgi:hypothetical protein
MGNINWNLAFRTVKRKRKNVKGLLFTLLIILGILTTSPLFAQSPVTATVSRDTMTTDDTFMLTVRVEGSGGNISQPVLPNLDEFYVLGSSSASSTTSTNGNVTQELVFQYTLRPIQVGDLAIRPIRVTMNGQEFATDPITLTVTQGSNPLPAVGVDPQASLLTFDDFYMEAEVDNLSPYVGEQIVYTLKVYEREGIRIRANYSLPDFDGFWAQQDVGRASYAERGENGNFRVSEFNKKLFPTVAGEQVIGESLLGVQGATLQDNLHTEPVVVTVRSLPLPAPDGFGGAVGQFALSAETDSLAVAADEALTLRVTMVGFGNVDLAPNPTLPEMDGVRVFDGTSTTQSGEVDGRYGGQRVLEWVIVPENAGIPLTIPPITYTYFDPSSESYQTAQTDPIIIDVTGDIAPEIADNNNEAVPVADVDTPVQSDIERLATDIRHIKPATTDLPTEPAINWLKSPLFWAAWLLPLLAVGGNMVWQRQAEFGWGKPVVSSAQQVAVGALRAGKASGADSFVAVERALVGYLRDGWKMPASFTHQQIGVRLQEKGVPSPLVEQVENLFYLCQMGRFAPVTGGSDTTLYDQAEQLINELATTAAGEMNG